MPLWMIQLILQVAPQVWLKLNETARRRQLVKDFADIDKMDISNEEKRALRRALVRRYNNGE